MLRGCCGAVATISTFNIVLRSIVNKSALPSVGPTAEGSDSWPQRPELTVAGCKRREETGELGKNGL